MSGNSGGATAKIDARIRRTRDRLGDALVELILEKPFDEINVQDILDRAGVGRSTFYTHYRDKDDLFLSDVEDFFQMMSTVVLRSGERSERIAPVRELFAHLSDVRQFHAALVTAGKIHDTFELGQGHFARAIEQRLGVLEKTRGLPPQRRAALGHAFAGALLSLLSWWMDHGMLETPEEMDVFYHQTVVGTAIARM
ncbi:MAG TPA: TetR/AcrR family transcriptional regulator [Bryobacteraceae bacterium]|jgi:AcrR family transcriptional regulator